MKKRILFTALLFIGLSSIPHAYPQIGEAELRERMFDAFQAVVVAENAGGDVSELVQDLNAMITLTETDGAVDPAVFESYVVELISQASQVQRSGVSETRQSLIISVSVVLVLLASAGLVWFYGSRVFWSVWLRIKRGWVVKRL